MSSLKKAEEKLMRSLPKSPSKRKAVAFGFAKRVGLAIRDQMNERLTQHHLNAMSEDDKEIIRNFFLRPDIVWTAPGMKDEMCVWGENGEKMKLRKLFLTHFLKEVFSLFKEEYPDIKVGFSKFCSLRPVNVLLMKKTSFDQCKCAKHENFMFILKGLGSEYSNIFWDEILCESGNLGGKCWLNKCDECMNGRKLEKSFLGDKNVSWNEWRKNLKSGKLEMCINQGKKNELRKNLFKSYAFQCHVRVKRLQVRVFE